MSRKRWYSLCRCLQARSGIIALNEVFVMIGALTFLFWLGSQFVTVMTIDPAATASSTGCSDRSVYRLALDQAGRQMWVYRPREGVLRINLDTNEVEQSLLVASAGLYAVAHSRNGTTSLLCGLDGTASLFRHGINSQSAQVKREGDIIVDAAVSHNGSVAACATSRGEVIGWKHLESEVREFSYQLPSSSAVMATGLNSTGSQMYVAQINGTVTFHDPETGTPVRNPLPSDEEWNAGGGCTAFAWSIDETLFAVANSRGQVRTYELATGKVACYGAVNAGTSSTRTTTVAISPDRRILAVATNAAAEVSLWNLNTGESAGSLNGHTGIVRAIQFAPTSKLVYSGSYDGTIREWSLE